MSRIGIMGGTFDPIHFGHLMLGRQACEEYSLDLVCYMPSGQPPHKQDREIAPACDRLSMTRLAVEGLPSFYCSDFEIKRPGLTYSSDTLTLLKEKYPAAHFYFIVGADSFYEIETWHEPAEILKRATILAARREYKNEQTEDSEFWSMEKFREHLVNIYNADIRFLHSHELNISSHEIRRLIAGGKSIRNQVPAAVADYIDMKGLYREGETHNAQC